MLWYTERQAKHDEELLLAKEGGLRCHSGSVEYIYLQRLQEPLMLSERQFEPLGWLVSICLSGSSLRSG